MRQLTKPKIIYLTGSIGVARRVSEQLGYFIESQTKVIALESWIQTCFFKLKSTKRLLTQAESKYLLLNLLQGHRELIIPKEFQLSSDSFDPTKHIHHLLEAWKIHTQWEVPIEPIAPSVSNRLEESIFFNLAHLYQTHLDKQGLLDYHQLIGTVTQSLDLLSDFLPETIELVGFFDYLPCVKRLLNALKSKGVQIQESKPQFHFKHPLTLQSYTDSESEIESVLTQIIHDPNWKENSRYLILLPELKGHVKPILNVLTRLKHRLPEAREKLNKIHISKGVPLNQEAAIIPIESLLMLSMGKSNSLDHIMPLLTQLPLSLADLKPLGQKVLQLTKEIKTQGKQEFTLDDLLPLLPDDWHPSLLEAQRHLLSALDSKHKQPYHFPFIILETLNAWHYWIEEDDLRNLFIKSLDQAHHHNASVAKTISFYHLFEHWRTLLGEYEINRSSKTDAPIQILSLLEAFHHKKQATAIFLIDACEHKLPYPTRFNPFISIDKQILQQVSPSIPEKQWKIAEHLIEQLKASTHSLFISYSKLSGTRTQNKSILFSHWDEKEALLVKAALPSLPQEALFEKSVDLAIQKHLPPSISASTLATMAKCPFQAFMKHRLKITPHKSQFESYISMTKGKIFHRCLEILFQAHAQTSITQIAIKNAARQAVSIFKDEIPSPTLLEGLSETTASLIGQLYDQLLIHFPKRNQIATEQAYPIDLQWSIDIPQFIGKALIDRIDTDSQGSMLIIDYKTKDTLGLFDKKDTYKLLKNEALLQLKLYQQILGQTVKAVAYVFIESHNGIIIGEESFLASPDFKNLRDSGNMRFHSPEDWHIFTQESQADIQATAFDYQAGLLHATPSNHCEYCLFKNFCRLDSGFYIAN